MDTDDEIKGVLVTFGIARRQSGRHDPSQLDGKQSHAGFNYDKHDIWKFSSASDAQSFFVQGSSSFDLPEYLEDPEHDKTRYQSIQGRGHDKTGDCHIGTPGSWFEAVWPNRVSADACHPQG